MSSFKQGIPLLDAFGEDVEDDNDGYDPTYSMPKGKIYIKTLCKRNYLIIAGIAVAVSLLFLVCLVAIPLSLIHLKGRPGEEIVVLGNITKSELDTKQYRAIRLSNNLRVLLVSDSEAEECAAAMDVAVGSFSNPKEYQGLAHFCEHMLFYANEKYPEEGAYAEFLSSHGGYDNAYTSTQNTNYHFKVSSDYLKEALDRFAQFFISPVFSSSAVGREVNAVDAEHRKNLQNDDWRLWQLLKQVSNPDHPFHGFSTGDLETLDKPGVLDGLKDFYSAYYSANEMQLVIYGKEDIPTLIEYADLMFSSIKNKLITRPAFAPLTSFPDGYNGNIVYYIPVADRDSVSLYWQVSPLSGLYREQIGQFLNYMLGHEGHGSIIDNLRRHSWAFDLTAYTEVNTDSYTLMAVDISLTKLGLSHVSDVIGTVIQYVSIINSASNEELQQNWKDFVDVRSINFKYAPKADPDSFVSSIASSMRNIVDPSDFLSSPDRFVLNTTMVKETISILLPSKAVIFVGSQTFENSSITQDSTVPLPELSSLFLIEPIYGTQYQETKVTQALIAFWSSYGDKLHLPFPPTDFLPKNFSILPPPHPIMKSPINLNEGTIISDGVAVWWLQDTYYNTPKIDMYCDINSAQTSYSLYNPQWTALTALYTTLVTGVLQSDIYAASLVDFKLDFKPTAHGVRLQINGYSDFNVLERFMKIIVNALHNESLLGDDNMFMLARESLIDDLRNYNFTALPYRYVYQYVQSVIMDRPKWKNWQLINELKNDSITTDVLLKHMKSLLMEGSTLLCFVHGNIDKAEALKLSYMIQAVLTGHSLVSPMGQIYGKRLALLPGNYSVVMPTLNPNDNNSVLNVVFQIGTVCDVSDSLQCSESSLRRTAQLGLITLKMKQSCFDVLRTQLQLGYVAYCTNRINNNIASFQVLVQSGTRNTSDILKSIDEFLLSYNDTLSEYLSTSFNYDNLISVYNEVTVIKPLTLSDSTDLYWDQIQSGLLQFDFKQQLINITSNVTANDLLDFYNKNFLNYSTSKKLVIGIYGNNKTSSLDAIFENSIDYINLDPRANMYP